MMQDQIFKISTPMFVAHEFQILSKYKGNVSIFQPPLTFSDQLIQTSYLGISNQLITQQQFSKELLHTATNHKITALAPITVKQIPMLALGTEDLNQQAHILIYDQQKKQLINSIDIAQSVQLIISVTDSIILAACDDYCYGYQLSTSKTTGCTELFWSVSNTITHVFSFSVQQNPLRVQYCLLCKDLTLRYFENEVLVNEYRTFSKTVVTSCKYYQGYISVLAQNSKYKLLFIDHEKKFKLLMSQDIQDVIDIDLVFKPYAKLANSEDFMETVVGVTSPLPFVLLQYQYKQDLCILYLDQGKLILKKILTQDIKGSHLSIFISEREEYNTFMRQYIECHELQQEELPFTADQVRKDCKQLIAVQGDNEVKVFEFPFIFQFKMLLEALNEMEGSHLDQIGVQIPKKKSKQQADVDVDNAGGDEAQDSINPKKTMKKTMRRVKKIKHTDVDENPDYQEICNLQSELFSQKMATLSAQQNVDGMYSTDLQLSFAENGQLQSELGDILTYEINFDGKPFIFNNQKVIQQKIPSNFDLNSDLINNAVEVKQQLQFRDFAKMSNQQKQRFIQQNTNQALPINLAASTQQAVVVIQLNQQGQNQSSKKQIICQQVEMKTCVLPAFTLIRFEHHAQVPQDSCICFSGVSEQQFKLLFQLQNVKCQLQAEFYSPVLQTSVDITKNYSTNQQLSQDNALKKSELYIKFNKEGQTVSLLSQNLRAILTYSYVFMRVAKLQEPQLMASQEQRKILSILLKQRIQTSLKCISTHGNVQDLVQAQSYSVNDLSNKLSQKNFSNVFMQYDGVIQKSFNDVAALHKMQTQLQELREDITDLVDSVTAVNKQLGQKISNALADVKTEAEADEWAKIW